MSKSDVKRTLASTARSSGVSVFLSAEDILLLHKALVRDSVQHTTHTHAERKLENPNCEEFNK